MTTPPSPLPNPSNSPPADWSEDFRPDPSNSPPADWSEDDLSTAEVLRIFNKLQREDG